MEIEKMLFIFIAGVVVLIISLVIWWHSMDMKRIKAGA